MPVESPATDTLTYTHIHIFSVGLHSIVKFIQLYVYISIKSFAHIDWYSILVFSVRAHTRISFDFFALYFSKDQKEKMALIGDIPRFYNAGDDWQVFTERLEQFFEINDVADEKKRAILLTSISDDVYKTLRDVCHPVLPKNKTFDELCALLNKQFVKKTSVFRERVTFYNAKQMKDESIASWFARIKKLSVDCKFGDRFNDILLDRFISGLKSSVILERLCEEDEDKLTLQGAVEIAITKESAMKEDHDDDDDEDGGNSNQRSGRNRGGRNRRNKKD